MISTPVSIVAALAAAARAGVLIKGGIYVETPVHLQAVAIDKTGTPTQGRPAVAEAIALNGYSETRLLQIVAGIESRTDHPLAQALVSYAKTREIPPEEVTDVQALPGKGITGRVAGRSYWLGSHRHAAKRAQDTAELREHAERQSRLGRSIVFASDDERVIGLIAFADKIRPGIRDVVQINPPKICRPSFVENTPLTKNTLEFRGEYPGGPLVLGHTSMASEALGRLGFV